MLTLRDLLVLLVMVLMVFRSCGMLHVDEAVPTAAGNKYYEKIGDPGVMAMYARVLNDRLAVAGKYRTVVDGFSYHRMITPNPNPFNPRTAIRFSLAADGPAKLVIYDVNGRRIRILIDSGLKAGVHEVVWDGADDAGRAVASGVYWSQLQAGDYSSNKKMVLLK